MRITQNQRMAIQSSGHGTRLRNFFAAARKSLATPKIICYYKTKSKKPNIAHDGRNEE
jgi:hypothetical protein